MSEALTREQISPEQRKSLLSQRVTLAVSSGGRVESQSDTMAVIVRGRRVNHVLHLILSVLTLSLWIWVWLALSVFGGEKRSMISVDEYGNVHESQNKKAGFGRVVGYGAMAFVGLAILAIGIAALGSGSGSAENSVAPPGSSSSGNVKKVNSQGQQTGTIGDVVHVGDLDLTILSVEAGFDSAHYNMFNDANIVVRFTATNARGSAKDTYEFTPQLAFKLVDNNGAGTGPEICADCPDQVDSASLVRGGTVSGAVYFKGTSWTQIRYQSLFSNNSAIITPN